MFRFNICKNLRRVVAVRTCPPIVELHFTRSPSVSVLSSLRYISSNENSTNEHSFTVSYLVNSCGLSPEYAISVSKHLRFKTLTQPDSVPSLLKNLGFSETEITKLVGRYPKVLKCNPEETLLPKLKFFQSKGFASSDITNMLVSCPELLKRSLENGIIPAFNFLNNILQSDDKAVAAIKRCHILLAQRLEKDVASKINLLKDKGVSEINIVNFLLYWPRMFMTNFDKFKRIVEEALDNGFDPSKGVFVEAVVSLKGMSKSTWEKKVKVYKQWNLSEEEILAAFRKEPRFMAMSEHKIMAVMDLFVNKLGWESLIIVKHPLLTTLSVEKRLIPRASVLQFLRSKGLINTNFRSTSLFYYPETKFLQKFVNRFVEAPAILKLYEKKSVLPSKQDGG